MPIYTRTGDDGWTGLFGNRRVPKDDLRIEAYGTVDELNSLLGLVRAEPLPAEFDGQLEAIQNILFEIGADLATEGGKASLPRVEPGTAQLEQWIDQSEQRLPRLTSFVLPGGTRLAGLLHVVRTVARRAERHFWSLARAVEQAGEPAVPPQLGVYLNRLSDLCFSWARRANADAGKPDVPWRREG